MARQSWWKLHAKKTLARTLKEIPYQEMNIFTQKKFN